MWALAVSLTLGSTVRLEAHATLLRTTPASNSRADQAPARVELFFNEGIEPIFNSLRVFNRNGFRIDDGQVGLSRNAKQMFVGLKNDLPQGVYTVDWRATSSDGHQIGGHFGFSVGVEFEDSETPAAPPGPWAFFPSFATIVSRWLFFAALVALFGGFAFGVLVLLPSRRRTPEALHPDDFTRAAKSHLGILRSAWVFLLLASLLTLLVKASAMADVGLLQAARPDVLRGVLSLTQFGQMWAAAFLLTVLAGLALWLSGRDSSRTAGLWLGTVLGLLSALAVSNSGHAAAVTEWKALALGADSLHVAATMIWVGGLFYLALLMRSLRSADGGRYAAFMGEVVPRFSRVAQICVAVLVLSGVYTAKLHMPSWSSFLTTLYGKTLLAKLLMFAPLVAIGAVNLLVIKPKLTAALLEGGARTLESAAGLLARFRGLVRAEVILGAAILLAVAVLTNVPPATAEAETGPVLRSNQSEFDIQMHLTPNRVGRNDAKVVIREKNGKLAEELETVALVVSMMTMDMGNERIEAKREPAAEHYQFPVVLGMAGKWQIDVRIVRKGTSTLQSATFETEVSP